MIFIVMLITKNTSVNVNVIIITVTAILAQIFSSSAYVTCVVVFYK